jgi:hypothetical protein
MTTRYVDGDGPGPLPSGVWADTIGDTTLSVTARRTHSGASDQPLPGECGGAEHSMDRPPSECPASPAQRWPAPPGLRRGGQAGPSERHLLSDSQGVMRSLRR